MGKQKTNSGTKKRFKHVGTRKNRQLRRRQANKNHILTKKAQDRKRRLRGLTLVKRCNLKAIKRLLARD